MKGRITVGTYDAQTLFAYCLCLTGAYEEGDISSSLGETAAKITPDGTSPDYQDAHRRIMWDSWFVCNLCGLVGHPTQVSEKVISCREFSAASSGWGELGCGRGLADEFFCVLL